MGFATAALIGLGVVTAGVSIAQGFAASKEDKSNASLMGEDITFQKEQYALTAKTIDAQKGLESYQYEKQKKRLVSTITARTAKAGLEFSGSPMAVMLDDLTQMELDKQIGQYNLDIQKREAAEQASYGIRKSEAAQAAYKRKAKTSSWSGFTNAFTSLLSTGANYAMYKETFMPKR